MPLNNEDPVTFGGRAAVLEAGRCLYCFDAPCTSACPVHIDIPGFIAMIRSGNLPGAAGRIRSANALASVCGKVCPSEIYCLPACTRGKQDSPVRIRELHRYATQSERAYALRPVTAGPTGKRAAVIGGGPAGLACAYGLAALGHGVDLYNDGPPGGVPLRSIPSFRLPEEALIHDTRMLLRYFTIHDAMIDGPQFGAIAADHDAVFIGVGLGRDRPLGIPGEDRECVYPVLEFLERAKRRPHTIRTGERVIVVGGGNVSLDAAATAKRLGAKEVTLLYRRTEREMRAWSAELAEARRQGVGLRFLAVPVEIAGRNGKVENVMCRAMRLSAARDASGRPVPVEIERSDFILPADSVVIAIGQEMKAEWLTSLRRTSSGFVEIGKDFQTSAPGVFAGGDAVSGEGTIVLSVAHGAQAAQAMHEFMMRKRDGE